MNVFNQYLGEKINRDQPKEMSQWLPKDRYGENWMIGDCSGHIDAFKKQCVKYTLHYKSFLRQPVAYPENKFTMIPAYRMYLFNKNAVSLN